MRDLSLYTIEYFCKKDVDTYDIKLLLEIWLKFGYYNLSLDDTISVGRSNYNFHCILWLIYYS